MRVGQQEIRSRSSSSSVSSTSPQRPPPPLRSTTTPSNKKTSNKTSSSSSTSSSSFRSSAGISLVLIATITIFSKRLFGTAVTAGVSSSSSRSALLFSRLFYTTTTTTTTTTSKRMTDSINPLKTPQRFKLIDKTKLSPDSFWLKYELAAGPDAILGLDPKIPTCIKVDYPNGTDKKTGEGPKTLSKSYSPVSHPETHGVFELIVKSYEEAPGGGVGKFICDMEVGDSITATLKKERIMHGSSAIEGRWNHVGLIAGGTGIAPLLQIARILLESPSDTTTKIHLLFVNRHEHDVLGHTLIDEIAQQHPEQFSVTYALTAADDAPDQYEKGRGTVELALKALPPPSSDGEENKTMIFVCGKDGFVAHWAGPVSRAPNKPDGSKGPKIQGPLLGILKEAGYTAEQVFKY